MVLLRQVGRKPYYDGCLPKYSKQSRYYPGHARHNVSLFQFGLGTFKIKGLVVVKLILGFCTQLKMRLFAMGSILERKALCNQKVITGISDAMRCGGFWRICVCIDPPINFDLYFLSLYSGLWVGIGWGRGGG